MSEKNLVICDRELRYAVSLAENLSKRKDLAVKVYVCSSPERVRALFQERPVHLFLVDEAYRYEERHGIGARQTFVLTKDKASDLGEEECEICKFRHANVIIREVFERYLSNSADDVTRRLKKEKTKLVAIYSPIHRCGKTQFAIALGKAYAKKGKTLYLNLEEYAGLQEEEEQMDLGDLLYYIKQGNANLSLRLPAAVRKWDELDYILPVPFVIDLKEIAFREWETLLEQIMQYSEYETVILDMGDGVQGMFRLLQMCDRIYMPILEDSVSQQKLHRYERTVQELQLTELERNTHRFVLPEQIEAYANLRVKEEC